MTNLSEIMTDSEKAAVTNLIKAHLVREFAKIKLTEAEATYRQAARYLTEECNRTDGKDEYGHPVFVSTIPASLVVSFDDKAYLVEIDEEGDSGHCVRLIGGVL